MFLRAGQVELLEKMRTDKYNKSAIDLQKNYKRMVAHKIFLLFRRSATHIQRGKRMIRR